MASASGTTTHLNRLWASVVAADVVGYTRLMELDELGIHRRLMSLRSDVLLPHIAGRNGRIVKNTGDGFLAMFADPRKALEFAIDMQRQVIQREQIQAADQRINFRLGINVAEVIVEDHDIYGDGVNIAARLQSYAEPGGIVISSRVEQEIGGTLGLSRVNLGPLQMRNLIHPVHVLSLRLPEVRTVELGELPAGYESRPSIAVLPFRNLGPPDDAYFSDGIVDNIIQALATLKELFVISRGSTQTLRDSNLSSHLIGRDLGVKYVLRGSAQRAGDRLRINTELIEAESGQIVRAGKYDGLLADLFDLQDRIAVNTIKIIAPHVRDRELKRAQLKRAQDMTAYDLVLQALHILHDVEYTSFSRARTLLQRAIAVDPTYAPAYTYSAYWHGYRIGQGWSTDIAMDASAAERLAQTAIKIDEDDATALAIHAHVQSFLMRNFDVALASFERALAVGPNSSFAWTLSAATFSFLGDGATAVARAQTGLNLSPIDALVSFAEHILSQAHFVNQDFEEAVVWGMRSFGRNKRLTSNLRILAAGQVEIGELAAARETVRQHIRVAPEFTLDEWLERTPLGGAARKRVAENLTRAGMRFGSEQDRI
jgi:adenylate cyclase